MSCMGAQPCTTPTQGSSEPFPDTAHLPVFTIFLIKLVKAIALVAVLPATPGPASAVSARIPVSPGLQLSSDKQLLCGLLTRSNGARLMQAAQSHSSA